MTDKVIYDRGYRTYDGPRLGPAGARRAVYKDGLRRSLGFGRKARYKIIPWTLITFGLVAAAVILGIHWAIGDLAESILAQEIPSYGDLFDLFGWVALFFIAFAGPQMLIPDRTKGVLSVYFSRPLTVDGYLTSKVGAFATVVAAIYLVPQLVLHIGFALISSDGFITYMGDNLDILWKVPLTTLAFVALHGSVVFILASVIDRTGITAAAFLGLFAATRLVIPPLAEASFRGARWISLLALDHHPRIIRDRLLGDTVEYPAEAAGFEVWASVVVIAVLVIGAVAFVRARYRRLA